jgi:hypothetical protein
MIKLETQTAAPQASAFLTIQSATPDAVIVLSSTDAWKKEADDFVADETKRKQVVSFINNGRTVEMIGAVPEADCVEIAAAHRVVAQIMLLQDKKQAGVVRPAILRITEVWTSPTKCLWKAETGAVKGPPATMGADGRILKGAA